MDKNAVMVIAPENFRDEEYETPRRLLEEAGVRVTLASSSMDPATGKLGSIVQPDLLLEDIRTWEYDCLVFVGGGGASVYFDDERAFSLARRAVEDGLVVGAICIAPHILAKAGLLDGVKATVFESEIDVLEEHGALYTGADVESDSRIVTARGPEVAGEFGRTLVEVLRLRDVKF